MIFGYIRESANWSIVRQTKLLDKAGVPASRVRTDKIKRGSLPDRDAVIRMLRPGDKLAVAGLGRLGTDHADLRHTLDAVFKRKGVVLDVALGTEIHPGNLAVLESYKQARADWMGERTIAGRRAAKARGLRGGRPKIVLTLEQDRRYRKIWFNQQIRDSKIAAQQITGEYGENISESWLEKYYGASGRPRNKGHLDQPKRKR